MASVEIPTISIVLGFFLSYLVLCAASKSAAQGKASGSIVVTGNVFCDTCLEGRPSEKSYPISGASVVVECRLNRKSLTVSISGETDENGEFMVVLPSNIFQSADQLGKCSVKPLKSPYNTCRIPSKSAPASSLTLQSFVNGVLKYSAGSFSYRHETVPASCYRKHFLRMMRGRGMAENVDQAGQQTSIKPSFDLPPQLSLPNFRGFPPFAFPPMAPGILPPFPRGRPPFAFPPLPPTPQPGGPGISPNPEPSTPGISPQPLNPSPFGAPPPLPNNAPSGTPPPLPADAPYGATPPLSAGGPGPSFL